jgi:glutathione S-transferase
MSDTKHTPGPWYLRLNPNPDSTPFADENWQISGQPDYAPWIAETYGGLTDGVAEANGRLIAAAPDLLEALIGLSTNPRLNLGDLIYQIRERELEGWDGPAVTAWAEAVEKAKAAIKKARGES